MTSPLFGPDGTQPPDADDALSDPLVGPATGSVPVPPLPLPPAPDGEAIRRAVAAAMAREEAEPPARWQPEPPATPPDGFPVPPPPPPPPAGRPPYLPPLEVTQPLPAPVIAPRPQWPPAPWPAGRSRRSRLVRAGGTGSGWVGCLVVALIFAAAAVNMLGSLIAGLLDLIR